MTPNRTVPARPTSESRASVTCGCTSTIDGRVKTVELKREGARWYVICSCEDVPVELLPATGREIGVDMGVAHFATLTEPLTGVSDEAGHLPNPRFLRTVAAELADAQRDLARKKRGSNRRAKAAKMVGKIHRRVARQRADHAHKTALALVTNADFIAVEGLRIANMVKAPQPKPDPVQPGTFLPNGAASKAGLNKSILDAGWGVFLSILIDKAERAGRVVISVNPANTSRTCPAPGCGHVSRDNRIAQADFACVRCGFTANADVVGATNVLRAGLVLREAASAA